MKSKTYIITLGLLSLFLPACTKEKPEAMLDTNRIDTVYFEDYLRTFLLHVPDNLNKNIACPLVIVLHGYTSNALQIESGSKFSELADSENFIVLYPEGLRYPWTSSNPRAWNAGNLYEEWTGGTNDVGYISYLIDRVSDEYTVDAKKIFVTGHSNGSRMTYRAGYELSDRIAAIAPMAGQTVIELLPQSESEVSLLHVHALDDNTVYYNGDSASSGLVYEPVDTILTRWAAAFHVPLSQNIIDQTDDYMYTELGCNTENCCIRKLITNVGGHHWLTVENSGVDATRVIWEFFKEHPKK